MKTVIGLDPGSTKSAFIHWDGKEILNKGIHPNKDLLEYLAYGWFGIRCFRSGPHKDIILAIESMVHITMGGKSIVDTLLWAGRFYQAWQGEKEFVPVHVVRKALGAQNDPGIRAALIMRFGEPGTKKDPNPITYGLQGRGYHFWRAFSVAVVWHDHLEFQGREMK